jgi:hypothetical protein
MQLSQGQDRQPLSPEAAPPPKAGDSSEELAHTFRVSAPRDAVAFRGHVRHPLQLTRSQPQQPRTCA